jgi:hypothetical protein
VKDPSDSLTSPIKNRNGVTGGVVYRFFPIPSREKPGDLSKERLVVLVEIASRVIGFGCVKESKAN